MAGRRRAGDRRTASEHAAAEGPARERTLLEAEVMPSRLTEPSAVGNGAVVRDGSKP